MLPSVLKNFNGFLDGVNFAGKIDEIALPKLSRKMEEIRAGGMNGPISVDMGQEKLETELTLGGMVVESIKQYAATKHDTVMLRFAGAYQNDTVGTVQAVEVVVRGRYQEMDFGNAKAGDKNQTKIKMQLSYYKLTIDNVEQIEIDLPNFVERIGGVDVLAQQRAALGLA